MFSVPLDLLEPSARSGIMIGTFSSVFDSSVPSLEIFTMLPLAHTESAHTSSGTPCTSGMLSRCNHLHCVGALAEVLANFHALSRRLVNSTGPRRRFLIQHDHFIGVSTFIGNATIPLTMLSAIMTISAVSCSYSHGSPSASAAPPVSCVARLAPQVSVP